MKKIEIGLSITVLVTITLTMIVIFAGVFIYFFPVKEDNFEIITPLIGIVGAVLGGVISGALTLVGVKLTIYDKIKSEKTKELPWKLEASHDLERLLIDLKDLVLTNEKDGITGVHLRPQINKFLKEHKMSSLALNVNELVYKKIKFLEMSTYDVYRLELGKIYLNKIDSKTIQDVILLVEEEKEKIVNAIFK